MTCLCDQCCAVEVEETRTYQVACTATFDNDPPCGFKDEVEGEFFYNYVLRAGKTEQMSNGTFSWQCPECGNENQTTVEAE